MMQYECVLIITGEPFHESNKENILKRAAKIILRDDVDMFIQKEKQTDPVEPTTVLSLVSCRERYPLTLNLFFITLLKSKNPCVFGKHAKRC